VPAGINILQCRFQLPGNAVQALCTQGARGATQGVGKAHSEFGIAGLHGGFNLLWCARLPGVEALEHVEIARGLAAGALQAQRGVHARQLGQLARLCLARDRCSDRRGTTAIWQPLHQRVE